MKFLVTGLLALSLNSFAGSISVKNERVRLLPPSSQTTGVFMKISNSSDKDIKLVKAESKRSKIVELHNHIKIDGVMKMREVPFILVPAGESVMLKPGSFHVMLINLNGALKKDEMVSLKLIFDNGESLEISPLVRKMKVLH